MEFHLHPDGLVFIRDEAGAVLYCEPRVVYERDVGEKIALPAGMVQAHQRAGVMTFYDEKGNAFPLAGTGKKCRWAHAERAIAARRKLAAASAKRGRGRA